MYEDLIKRLRYAATYDPRIVVQDCEDAADIIEELQAYADLYEYTSSLGLKLARSVLEAWPKWVPVSDRLPEKSGWYLTRCNQWGGFIHRIALCAVQDRTWTEWTDKEYDITEYVTHWMAIPQVPEEAEDDLRTMRAAGRLPRARDDRPARRELRGVLPRAEWRPEPAGASDAGSGAEADADTE